MGADVREDVPLWILIRIRSNLHLLTPNLLPGLKREEEERQGQRAVECVTSSLLKWRLAVQFQVRHLLLSAVQAARHTPSLRHSGLNPNTASSTSRRELPPSSHLSFLTDSLSLLFWAYFSGRSEVDAYLCHCTHTEKVCSAWISTSKMLCLLPALLFISILSSAVFLDANALPFRSRTWQNTSTTLLKALSWFWSYSRCGFYMYTVEGTHISVYVILVPDYNILFVRVLVIFIVIFNSINGSNFSSRENWDHCGLLLA